MYAAEDLDVGRRVAIKFLPESLEKDPLTLERVTREILAVSALKHPNICTVYEVGSPKVGISSQWNCWKASPLSAG